MGLAAEICFQLAKRMVLNRQAGSAGENPATFDRQAYHNWRVQELNQQYSNFFDASDVEGRDVLDFGCGEGPLSFHMATLGVRSITGIDVNEERICSADAALVDQDLPVRPTFVHAKKNASIELPDNSVDVLLCFDVLEHVMDYKRIIPEWTRILREDGRVLIWWVPWYHPYGPHIESLVPIPWAHVVFSDQTLIETCAKIYDMPEFKPRIWDMDGSGDKRSNKWKNIDVLPEVNRLTMAEFERICAYAGLKEFRKQLVGFGGSSPAKLTRLFLRFPFLREFFTSCVVYDLRKSA